MNENYTNNSELIIQYIDNDTGNVLMTQQTAIASVILDGLAICSYVTINGIDYIFIQSKLVISKDNLDKNIYQIFVENVDNYEPEIDEEYQGGM